MIKGVCLLNSFFYPKISICLSLILWLMEKIISFVNRLLYLFYSLIIHFTINLNLIISFILKLFYYFVMSKYHHSLHLSSIYSCINYPCSNSNSIYY